MKEFRVKQIDLYSLQLQGADADAFKFIYGKIPNVSGDRETRKKTEISVEISITFIDDLAEIAKDTFSSNLKDRYAMEFFKDVKKIYEQRYPTKKLSLPTAEEKKSTPTSSPLTGTDSPSNFAGRIPVSTATGAGTKPSVARLAPAKR